jgi:hypothetical protein
LDPATVSSPHPLAFHLQVGSGATSDLRTAGLKTSDLQDGVPYAVEFEPLRNSEGEDFYFYFESSALPRGAATIHYSPDAVVEGACPECKRGTSAVVNGQPVSGNLQFYTYYGLRTRDKVALLLTRLAGGRPYLLGTRGYYVMLAAVYVLLLAAFLWRVAHAILEDERS